MPERWPQVERIYSAVVARPESEWATALTELCAGDDSLRNEVESLLAHEEAASRFLETPAFAGADVAGDVASERALVGRRFGSYTVLAPIGSGGMGEVYRARDERLGRQVAIKLLPSHFASDPDRRARLESEARILAALNHAHISAIYGVEEVEGCPALVLEFVEGDTLAERLATRPLPLAQALAIARQIAEALEAAHERGIIHRDLKPANIKITPDGVVKVLDFGLAKFGAGVSGRSGESDAQSAATQARVAPDTRTGLIFGTLAYMSPEQATGRAADTRSDLFAFGVVLLEMLTGRPAFTGETDADLLESVLHAEPDLTRLPDETPLPIRRLLRRCLEKDRMRRLDSAAVARFEIDEAITSPAGETVPSARSSHRVTPLAIAAPPSLWRRMALPTSTWLAGVAMSVAAVWFATRAPISLPRVSRFLITPPNATALTVSGSYRDLALTPDGRRLVYVGGNGASLFVRTLDQLDATSVPGFNSVFGPFVSPDGQWIGVFDGASAPALKRVAITGGPAVALGLPDGPTRGASWGADGTIIFATTNATTGLQRIAAAGGEPTILTRPNRAAGEADHIWPEILPGGEAVLFTITAMAGRLDQAQVAVLDLRTGTQTVLIRGGSDARYVSSGHLIYATEGTLRAVAFDLARLAILGTSVAVLPGVQTTATGAANVAVAADGTLVYVPGGTATGARSSLVWVDRQGQETPLLAAPRSYVYPRLSPNGRHVAFFISDEELDIWLLDLSRSTLTRVTSDAGLENYPVWAPDGRQIFFSSERAGPRNLFAQAADGTGAITRLTESPNTQLPTSLSPDGTRLVFTEIATATPAGDVLQLRLDGTHAVTPLVQTPFNERNGEVSPDGRWLAYEANDSGRFEIYVRPFPDVTKGVSQVSTDGGTQPLWARNSRELFYLSATGALMRVGVAHGPTWAAPAPMKQFEGRYGPPTAFHFGRTYDVSPDGRRFLMIKGHAAGDASATPASMVVVLNWHEELKRLVPTK